VFRKVVSDRDYTREKGNRTTARASGIILAMSGRSEFSAAGPRTRRCSLLRLFLFTRSPSYTHTPTHIKIRFAIRTTYCRHLRNDTPRSYIIYINITCRPRAGPDRLENRFSSAAAAAVWFLVYIITRISHVRRGVRRHHPYALEPVFVYRTGRTTHFFISYTANTHQRWLAISL